MDLFGEEQRLGIIKINANTTNRSRDTDATRNNLRTG